jgi:exonuclease VII large subunit
VKDVNEKKMLKICLVGSITGLIALYFITISITPVDVNIGEVTGDLVGKVVNMKGTVTNFYEHKDGHYFFDIRDETGELKVVLWDNLVEQLRLGGVNVDGIRDGTVLELTGTLEIYKGELELIPLRSQVRILE